MGLQIYSRDGRSLLTNPAFREMFGSEPPPEYNVLEDEIAKKRGVLDMIRRAFAGEIVTTPPVWYDPRELEQVRISQGKRVCMSATFFPLTDEQGSISHIGVVFKDVTNEVAQRERLLAVIESFPEAVFIGNRSGIKIANAQAVELLGLSKEELDVDVRSVSKRLNVRDASTGRVLSFEEQSFGHALDGRPFSNEVIITHQRTGRDVFMRSTSAPIQFEGDLIGAVAVNVDLSDIRRTAEERDTFLAALGHDLRNPVSAIRLGADVLLKKGDLAPAAVRQVARIATSADRMTRLIGQLLDFARSRAGGLVLQRSECDLHAICREVIDEVELAYPGRAIRFRHEGDGRGYWDSDRLGQVVQNLLTNAVEHGARDEIVDVSVRPDGSWSVLEVANAGRPIPDEVRRHIFHPFRRGGHGERGVGLGLHIAHQIVTAHGGTLSIRSDEQETVFTVRLP